MFGSRVSRVGFLKRPPPPTRTHGTEPLGDRQINKSRLKYYSNLAPVDLSLTVLDL